MKITAGLGSIDEYVRYVEAGTDEFFCGYVPYEWNRKYGTVLPLNRREVLGVNVQIGAESELKILAVLVRRYGKPVHLTFNSLYYTPEQYPEIADIIYRCMELGFSSFIIADPALLVYLKDRGIRCEIHLSGETAEVNSRMMDVFDRLNVYRLIFHRKNSFADMESVIRHEREKGSRGACEFEAFVLNELCQFSGAFCNSLHCDEMGYLCRVPYKIGKIKRNIEKQEECSRAAMERIETASVKKEARPREKEASRYVEEGSEKEKLLLEAGPQKEYMYDEQSMNSLEEEYDERKYDSDGYLCGGTGCGLCALYQLRKAGITHLKLVGRGNYVDFMEKDIRNLRTALKILESAESESEYIREMKKKVFPYGCSGLCYYREKDKTGAVQVQKN